MTLAAPDSQETANIATHGLGFVLSLAGTVYLMAFASRQPGPIVIACGLYSATLLLTYAISTLSHAVFEPGWRKWWRMLDQSCIFLAIAGTYTPFAMIYLRHGEWWLMLATMWVLAFAGVLRVISVGDLPRSNKIAYGVLGLLPIVTLGEMSQQAPPGLALWLVAGGVFFLVGTIFLRLGGIFRYSHAVWHIFVVAGSTCHFIAVLQAVTCG